jgi:hypothetical protein
MIIDMDNVMLIYKPASVYGRGSDAIGVQLTLCGFSQSSLPPCCTGRYGDYNKSPHTDLDREFPVSVFRRMGHVRRARGHHHPKPEG